MTGVVIPRQWNQTAAMGGVSVVTQTLLCLVLILYLKLAVFYIKVRKG